MSTTLRRMAAVVVAASSLSLAIAAGPASAAGPGHHRITPTQGRCVVRHLFTRNPTVRDPRARLLQALRDCGVLPAPTPTTPETPPIVDI